ncbi:MAG: hypothetical protein ABL871_00815 [Terricaulis sp.]
MTTKHTQAGWVAALRRVFPTFLRDRHYASINQPARSAPPKMEPISKIVADAGRNSTTPAD